MNLTPCCRYLLLLLACCCPTAAAQDRPQILVLSSADSMLPAGRILSDEVQQGLEAGLGPRVEIFVEFLDALRFPEHIFKIGRASCRERAWQYESICVGA